MGAEPQSRSQHRLTKSPAWVALQQHFAKIRDRQLHALFAEDPARGDRMVVEAVASTSITQSTAPPMRRSTCWYSWRARRGCPNASKRCSAATRSTSPSIARCCMWRYARPKGTSIVVDGENVVPQVHAVLDRMTHV